MRRGNEIICLLKSNDIKDSIIKKVLKVIDKYGKAYAKDYQIQLLEDLYRDNVCVPKGMVRKIQDVIKLVSNYRFIGAYARRKYKLKDKETRDMLLGELHSILSLNTIGEEGKRECIKKIKNKWGKKIDRLDTPKQRLGIFSYLVKELVAVLNPYLPSCWDVTNDPLKEKTFSLVADILNVEYSDLKVHFTSSIVKARYYSTI